MDIYIYGFEWLGIWKSMSFESSQAICESSQVRSTPEKAFRHSPCTHQKIHWYLAVHTLCLRNHQEKTLSLYENATNPSKIHMGFAGKKMFPDMLPYFGRSISFSYGLPWSSHGRKAGYLLLFTWGWDNGKSPGFSKRQIFLLVYHLFLWAMASSSLC